MKLKIFKKKYLKHYLKKINNIEIIDISKKYFIDDNNVIINKNILIQKI